MTLAPADEQRNKVRFFKFKNEMRFLMRTKVSAYYLLLMALYACIGVSSLTETASADVGKSDMSIPYTTFINALDNYKRAIESSLSNDEKKDAIQSVIRAFGKLSASEKIKAEHSGYSNTQLLLQLRELKQSSPLPPENVTVEEQIERDVQKENEAEEEQMTGFIGLCRSSTAQCETVAGGFLLRFDDLLREAQQLLDQPFTPRIVGKIRDSISSLKDALASYSELFGRFAHAKYLDALRQTLSKLISVELLNAVEKLSALPARQPKTVEDYVEMLYQIKDEALPALLQSFNTYRSYGSGLVNENLIAKAGVLIEQLATKGNQLFEGFEAFKKYHALPPVNEHDLVGLVAGANRLLLQVLAARKTAYASQTLMPRIDQLTSQMATYLASHKIIEARNLDLVDAVRARLQELEQARGLLEKYAANS